MGGETWLLTNSKLMTSTSQLILPSSIWNSDLQLHKLRIYYIIKIEVKQAITLIHIG